MYVNPRANVLLCKKAEWFDNECKMSKNVYLNSVNKYNICKNDSNRLEMCNHKLFTNNLLKRRSVNLS